MVFLQNISYAKSVYVISNINASPSPIRAYDIQENNIVYQATYGVPKYAGGAVGLAIDTDTNFLFVTYEGSNVVQLVDGSTMTGAGSVVAPGASNMAGIVVDQAKSLVYAVDRGTNHLYIWNWNTWSHTLTLKNQLNLSNVSRAHGIALDETRGLLYIGDLTNTVKVFDTSDWSLSSTFNVSQKVMGIAVDTQNQFVYTGNAYRGYGSIGLVCKYDLSTGIEYTKNIGYVTGASGDNVLGLSVDRSSGILYLTTGDQGVGGSDRLLTLDSMLNLLDSTGDIGDPTGVCVPGKDISFNPLLVSIHTAIGDRPIGNNEELAYHICFSNPTSSIVSGVNIVDSIPQGTTFLSSSGIYTYDSQTETVAWDFGNINPGDNICIIVTVRIDANDGQVKNLVTINSNDYLATTKESLTNVTDSPDAKEIIQIGEKPELPVPDDIYSSWGTLSIYPGGAGFNANLPTVVISHGWNLFGSSDIPKWMEEMGDAIGDRANVLLWDWHEKAKSHQSIFTPPNPRSLIPYDNVPESGKQLAENLANVLKQYAPNYLERIHFIGHSLGSGVVVHAADHLKSEYRGNLDHLTLLDSPYYFLPPALETLYVIQDTTFVDNYRSAVGSHYLLADTNVVLVNDELLHLKDPHAYAHEWYRCSMNDFNPQPPLTPLLTIPSLTDNTPWGFYWSAVGEGGSASRSNVSWLYNSDSIDRWKLYTIQQNVEAVEWAVEVTTEAAAKWTQDKIDKLEDVAMKTGTKIKVISINTFETAVEVTDFVTDKAGNAIWEYATNGDYGFYGVLKLFINSEAIISADTEIPSDANSMRISFEYLLADKGCLLEIFINDISVYKVLSDEFLDKGVQESDWIDVSPWAGNSVKLSFRLSNPIDGKQGVVSLDDLLFTKIISYIDSDEDGILDGDDNCPENYNPLQDDSDGDKVGDFCDNCPNTYNFEQTDENDNGIGDACEFVPEDLNGDGCVDLSDYTIIITDIRSPEPNNSLHDLNGDGLVNITDARYLVTQFTNPRGVPCP